MSTETGQATELRRCTKERRLVDVRVVATFPHVRMNRWVAPDKRQEAYYEDLNCACREFHDFLRDHRSQDIVQLDTERDERDCCSSCGREWEPLEDADHTIICAGCGAIIQDALKTQED